MPNSSFLMPNSSFLMQNSRTAPRICAATRASPGGTSRRLCVKIDPKSVANQSQITANRTEHRYVRLYRRAPRCYFHRQQPNMYLHLRAAATAVYVGHICDAERIHDTVHDERSPSDEDAEQQGSRSGLNDRLLRSIGQVLTPPAFRTPAATSGVVAAGLTVGRKLLPAEETL